MEHEGSLSELEALIGYTFQDIKHLETAITHKSFVNEKMVGRYMSYERYEFLGDAILEFIVSKFLFENYQTMPEGDLSKLRSSLVCEFTLSKISRDLRFGEFARFSKGERQTGGANRDSYLCDMFNKKVLSLRLCLSQSFWIVVWIVLPHMWSGFYCRISNINSASMMQSPSYRNMCRSIRSTCNMNCWRRKGLTTTSSLPCASC